MMRWLYVIICCSNCSGKMGCISISYILFFSELFCTSATNGWRSLGYVVNSWRNREGLAFSLVDHYRGGWGCRFHWYEHTGLWWRQVKSGISIYKEPEARTTIEMLVVWTWFPFISRLKSRSGTAARDIVQFVPFRDFANVSIRLIMCCWLLLGESGADWGEGEKKLRWRWVGEVVKDARVRVSRYWREKLGRGWWEWGRLWFRQWFSNQIFLFSQT